MTDNSGAPPTETEHITINGNSLSWRVVGTLITAITYEGGGWYEKNYPLLLREFGEPDERLDNPEYIRMLEELVRRFETEFPGAVTPEVIANTVPREMLDDLQEQYDLGSTRQTAIKLAAERIAKTYITELEKYGGVTEEERQQVQKVVAPTAEASLTRGDSVETASSGVAQQIERLFTERGWPSETQQAVRQNTHAFLSSVYAEGAASVAAASTNIESGAIMRGATKSLLAPAPVLGSSHRPDSAVSFYLAGAFAETGPLSDTKQNQLIRGARLMAATSDAMLVSLEKDVAGPFLEQLAKPGEESRVHTLVSQLSEADRLVVAQQVVWEGMIRTLEKPDTLGAEVTSSPFFAYIRNNINGPLTPPSSTPPAGIRKLTGSLLSGATRELYLKHPDDAILAFLRTSSLADAVDQMWIAAGKDPLFFLRNQAAAPVALRAPGGAAEIHIDNDFTGPRAFYTRIMLVHIRNTSPAIFTHLSQDSVVTFFRGGARYLEGRVRVGLAGAAVKSGAATWVRGFITRLLKTAAGKALFGGLTGGVVGTVLGGPVGGVILFVGGLFLDKITGWFKNIFTPGGLSSMFSPFSDTFKRLAASQPGNKTVLDDKVFLFVAAGALALLIIVFLPALTLNIVKRSAFMDAAIGGGPGGPTRTGFSSGAPVAFAYSGPAPGGTITGCPVQSGTITQRPFGTFSHQNLNAFDISAPQGSPIYATHDAYVAGFFDGIEANTFLNSSYGNYVLLVADGPQGRFFTMYGHLLSVDPIVKAAKEGTRSPACAQNDPKLICAGDEIGTMDATGSTYGSGPGGTGTHLHYEYRGPHSDTAITLPPGCP